MAKIVVAPEKLSGDSIELSPLMGKMVAVYVRSRDTKKTKYGEKSMSHVVVFADGMKPTDEPLEGIMFQSYFQELKLNQWFVGIVSKQTSGRNEAWVLKTDKLDKKKTAEFVKIVSALEVTEEKETVL